jgi:hypothetical protein
VDLAQIVFALSQLQKKEAPMKKIDINTLPELTTKVGIHGSVKQREVGGAACTGVFVAVITG